MLDLGFELLERGLVDGPGVGGFGLRVFCAGEGFGGVEVGGTAAGEVVHCV